MLTIIPSNDSLSYYDAIAAALLNYGTVKAALFDHDAITSKVKMTLAVPRGCLQLNHSHHLLLQILAPLWCDWPTDTLLSGYSTVLKSSTKEAAMSQATTYLASLTLTHIPFDYIRKPCSDRCFVTEAALFNSVTTKAVLLPTIQVNLIYAPSLPGPQGYQEGRPQ